jgi:phenylacetate-coenzyme A ligase PaaK-like adenylate-forming protein
MITRKELQKIGLLPLRDIENGDDKKKYFFRTTSGTTGGVPLLILRKKKISSDGEMGFYSGLKRPMCFFGAYSARLGHLVSGIYRKENPMMLFIDKADLNKEFINVVTQFRPDSFCGFPSFIIKSLEYMDSRIFAEVKALRLTGEGLSKQKLEILRNFFPNASIDLFYAAGEVGFISGFCPNLEIGKYHPKEGVDVDLINVDEDGIGEILVSTNLSPLVKVDKYWVGDVGRFVHQDEVCKCGNPIIFELTGRKNFDFIKFGGAILFQSEFERVVSELGSYIVDFRGFIKESVVGKSKIICKISLEIIPTQKLLDLNHPEEYIGSEISRRLYVTSKKTLSELIAVNMFLPLEVHFKGQFDSTYKDVKLKKIN